LLHHVCRHAEVSENEYHHLADELLDMLQEKLEVRPLRKLQLHSQLRAAASTVDVQSPSHVCCSFKKGAGITAASMHQLVLSQQLRL
jgi:hypothetical protein